MTDDEYVVTLFRTHYADMCRAVARILSGDKAAAEQVVMEAFATLWQKRAGVRWDTADRYLWRIAINEAKTAAGRATRESGLLDLSVRRGFFPTDRSMQDDSLRSLHHSHVRTAVDRLPLDQRIAVVLHYYCDWPDAEIARVVGCPAVTVRSRLRRARKTLEHVIARAGETDE